MKSVRIILIIIIAAVMTACHSQKSTTRRPTGKEKPVALQGKAANKYTQQLMAEAYSWLGTPYKYGGTSKKGADCSGFVMTIFKNSLDIDLPRVSGDQGDFCRTIKKGDLFPGDLVFFASKGRINHVGLYVGDNKMLHASSSQGVVVCDLSMDYFAKHFHHAGMIPAYRDKVTASARSAKKPIEYKDNSKKTKAKKPNSSKKRTPARSVTSVPGSIPNAMDEIPASDFFNQKPETPKKSPLIEKTPSPKKDVVPNKNTTPAKEVTPSKEAAPKKELPKLPPLQPDSAMEIQADTVHLMVYFP